MFDFLFKRRQADTLSTKQAEEAQAAAAIADERTKTRQRERDLALQQATALRDEPGALAFILQCEFAEARLQAAQWLQSAEALAEALRAVRNSDRRVAKLLQTRLDALQRLQRANAQMRAVLEQAEALLRDPLLTPDRAADIDRAWSAAAGTVTVDDALAAQFAAVRDALSGRLGLQAQLQRSLVDTRSHLQKIQDALQAAASGETDPQLAAISATLDRLQQQIAEERDAPEAVALPKQLLPDCERLLETCRAVHARMRADLAAAAEAAARQQRKQQTEPIPSNPSELQIGQYEPQQSQQQQTVSPVPSSTASRPAKPVVAVLPRVEQLAAWLDLLARLEAALEQGALQAASETERALRGYDVRSLKPAAEAASRLNAAYAALHHLQGWARWGGNISREELLQAALALPDQALPVPELVQKIGGLRARWKLLSVSAGSAPQALWEQFDAACTAAYAPAAALYEQQDKERQENRVLAEVLIAEIDRFAQEQGAMIAELAALAVAADTAAASDTSAAEAAAHPGWKQLAQFEARMRQSWQRLGTLGHKEKRTLERAFDTAIKAVQAPLRSRQKIEIAARETMIEQVAELVPGDRQALDTLRRIQAEWQQRAQGVPLARKDEQALWQAFRTACDAVFAQRKEAALSQDAQRQANLEEKQALCVQLEQTLADAFDAALVQTVLQQTRAAWSRIGPVPRAEERAIEKRFRGATDALQGLLQAEQDNAAAAALAAEVAQIDERLAMCFALDAVLTQGALSVEDAEAWRTRWQAAPPVARGARGLEQILTQRFETALIGIGKDMAGAAYLASLQQKRPRFDDTLLEVEIALGLDSPPELARQRMQLQVALLQSSLKAGAASLNGQQQLARLAALPALADEATLKRIGNVVRQAMQR